MPITSGSQPETATERTSASGSRPCSPAKRSDVTSTAAAPSVSGDEVPAVTVPSRTNAGSSAASPASVVSGRGQPSSPTPATVTISSASRPPATAAAALRWLSTANASCSARPTPKRAATFSAVSPMLTYTSGRRSTRPGL